MEPMTRFTIALRGALGVAVALVASTGCSRVERPSADHSKSANLQADRGQSPPSLRSRPSPEPRPNPSPRPGAARATPAQRAPAKVPRPAPDSKDQPQAVKPGEPAPLVVQKAGATPRLTLRYRFSNNDKLVWRTTMEQLTHVRSEKRCPADLRTKLRGAKVRTIPVRYGVDLATTVTRAPDGLYQLDTRLANVTMNLPSALTKQRQLLLKVLSGLRYTRRMSSRGQITRFAFGKMTPKSLLNLSTRLKAPLGHLQPMLPAAPVGVGAVWQHRRQHPLLQPGGRIDAIYLTQYRLTAIRMQGGAQVVDIEMTTKVQMKGKVMGNPFTGSGSGSAQLTLDAVRGVVRVSKGDLWICSAVKDRTSTNRTAFSQTLLSDTPAAPTSPKRPTPPRPMDPKPKTP